MPHQRDVLLGVLSPHGPNDFERALFWPSRLKPRNLQRVHDILKGHLQPLMIPTPAIPVEIHRERQARPTRFPLCLRQGEWSTSETPPPVRLCRQATPLHSRHLIQRRPLPMIRIATPADAEAIHAIYAPAVTDTAITFETELPGAAAMAGRIEGRLAHYPWLVWEEDGEVLAYAYAYRFRERAAYDWIAETSIYVHEKARRRGIARHLYGVLLECMKLQGINQA